MIKKINIITVILIVLCLNAFAQTNNNTAEVLPNLDNNPTNTSAVNDQLRQLQSRINAIEGGIDINSETSGILDTDRGGTGQDFSVAAQYSIPYFSDTGVMGNIGIGTTGYLLTATAGGPAYQPPPPTPKILIGTWPDTSGAVYTNTGVEVDNYVVIDSSTDWAGKTVTLIISADVNSAASFNGTIPSVVSTSSTALTGMAFRTSGPTTRFIIRSITLPTNGYTTLVNITGIGITNAVGIGTNSLGQLCVVSVANQGSNSGGGNFTSYSQIAGTILKAE